MGIGAKLDGLLKLQGSNPNELAQKINVPAQTIYSMIKRDSKKADIEVLIKISKELGVEPEYFCNDSIPVKEPAYNDVITVYTRSRKNLSQEEKMRLARIILSDDDDEE